MEKLKSLVPDSLKRMLAATTPDDLPQACLSLRNFFSHLETFHQMVGHLTDCERSLCGKNKDAALELKQKGNNCFLNGDYTTALTCYSQALRLAPVDADDMAKNLVATLYVNRASVLHKMDLLVECLRDCNRALQISPCYAKAWYRRGKVNASLGSHEDAARDLIIAKTYELSLSGRRQIEGELKVIPERNKRTEGPVVQRKENEFGIFDEQHQIKLKCLTTKDKGRGMVTPSDMPPTSLVHAEEPYATIILKHCRETHCHYCLNELPADTVSCTSCSTPLYCSQRCQIQAGGQVFKNYPVNHGIHENLSENLDAYIKGITFCKESKLDADIPEHRHECQGVNWPAILPAEIVLAGRVLIKSLTEGSIMDTTNFSESLDLFQNYTEIHPESKLQLHIYSIILSYCLQNSSGIELPLNGDFIAQIVMLISQIRVNSMTIVRMKSDVHGSVDLSRKFSPTGIVLTSNIEQVRVGQAIYKAGSLFNHSCQPNIHAYFLSRSLFIRATEFVAAGCPLELSYGPQVGQWDCKDRLKFLEDEYSFRCQCRACTEVNLSDLVLNAFHCSHPNCPGIVLDSCVANYEKWKTMPFHSATDISSLESYMEVNAYVQSKGFPHIDPGYCLKCSSYCELESSFAAVSKSWISIRRLQDSIVSREIPRTTLMDALRSLCILRSTLHAYNKDIAKVEDNLAEAFCLVGELKSAVNHCEASIEILEKIYGPNHIAIANELVKLSSIQLSIGDFSAAKNINRVHEIFSRYYGSHADMIFPYLLSLREESRKLREV